jgi:NAD(P)-dependent dehydrogenase (short-subunit alcohol dehydrogenase family)
VCWLSDTVHDHSVDMLTEDQAYAATKAAQIHLVKYLGVIASPNIRVNCVSSSMMLTVSVLLPPALFRQLTKP